MKLTHIFCTIFLISSCSSNSGNKAEQSTTNPSAIATKTTTTNISANMISFEGGSFMMGSNEGTPSEQPVHQVQVAPFKLDKSPVTVAEFSKFVESTGFKTDAEKYGDSGVFNFTAQNWELMKGAYWLYPLGPNAAKAEMNHPVTHVSWNDAQAYCQWAKKRLPTEAEWEYAARNSGKSKDRFSWGNDLVIKGIYMANVWQGTGTSEKQGADGFTYTSPVGSYGTTPAGLTDMGGNVWNWCQDTFKPYPGNPEPYQLNDQIKVIRGGSFFFDQQGELSYTVSFRGQNTYETSLFNLGFRCAGDAE
jgi:formylglycine-generating enzyme